MSDLISRQAAIDAFAHKWDGMVTSVFDVIEELPSAELRKGKWNPSGQYPYDICSECGSWFDTVNNEHNFCCNCGADMRGIASELDP